MKRSLSDQRQPSRVFSQHLQTIAIVACAQPEKELSTALTLRDDLRKRGMRSVDLFVSYPNNKSMKDAADEPWTAFGNRSFNWIGKLQSPDLRQALKQEYEVLIDLSEGRSFAADVLIAKLHAKWKVGRHSAQRAYLLDLMIAAEAADLNDLIHHIEHYLQTLNKPNAA